MLRVCRLHRRPAFIGVAEPRRYVRLSYICTCCVSAAITAGYIRKHCSFTVIIVDLPSYVLQNLVGTHRCPTFVHAACLPLLPLATHVCAPRLPSTPLNCVRTPCRTLSVRTAVLHSYLLRVCRHYRWLHSYVVPVCHQHRLPAFVRISKPRCYPRLSYIHTCCSSAVDIVDQCSYALQKLVGTHCSPSFVCAARMQ